MDLTSDVGSDLFHRSAAHKTKRSKTVARLMDAAVTLFAQRGVDATTVLDITIAAGVSNGTFYSYFKDKDEIATAVYDSVTATLVSDIVSGLDRIADGPSQIALGSIWFAETVSREPHWGWMIVRALDEQTPFREQSAGIIGRYVDNGVAQGHFKVVRSALLIDLMLAILVGAIRARLRDPTEATEQAGMMAAEVHLRMLGMSPAQARRIPIAAKRRHGERPESAIPDIQPPPPRHGPAAGRPRPA